jgi:adenine-specific DNA-methyltransferase
MDYATKTRQELLALCKEKKLKGYSGKKKAGLLNLLSANSTAVTTTRTTARTPQSEKVSRLNYIGSKYQLLDWLTSIVQEKTGWSSFEGKTVADLFGGTGIVSYHFRKLGAAVVSNDAELYSSIITRAFTRSCYTESCKRVLEQLQKDLDDKKEHVGFVTQHYSPYEGNERKFFTVSNAKRIDYLRKRLEEIKPSLSEDEYTFLLASILLSADAVSNVPAVYGCYLKAFKSKATKDLLLNPIHTLSSVAVDGSQTFHSDILNTDFLRSFTSDVVYLDPPYNERQYSKNYFPLNIIAKAPESLVGQELKGKTGIPSDCFISPFCKKGATVEKAFETLIRELKTQWVFLSYNSESLVSKDKMLALLKKYGEVSLVERDYKRFKSFEYNKDTSIQEYLFCLKKS